MDSRKWFVVILIVTLACVYLVVPMDKKPLPGFLKDAKINLGIDLAGGAELTYRVLFEDKDKVDAKAVTQHAIEVLRNRVDAKGLKDPKITLRGDDQIDIQLPGIDRDGLKDYMELFKGVGKLELRAAAPKDIQEMWNSKYAEGQPLPPPPVGFIILRNDEKMSGEYKHFDREYILVSDKTVITGTDIESSSPSQQITQGGKWTVDFQLNTKGAKDFDDAAKVLFAQNPRGLICIVMDGEIISKPSVNSPQFGGRGVISGNFDEKSATNLSIVLKSGSLPEKIGRWVEEEYIVQAGETYETIGQKFFGESAAGKRIADANPEVKPGDLKAGVKIRVLGPLAGDPEATNFVGPTLGQDSIRRGFLAAAVSFGLVAIFMIVYYRGGGIVATLSLVFNLAYLMAAMAFFGATMTLPGIAGIALTAGMAVDANILVFERMREELIKGKTLSQAFEAGHEKAFSAIFDSNLTTLIAGVVLFYFGTGAIQGFAVTLCIGILSTMFSVLVAGKYMLRLLISSGAISEFRMMRIFSSPNYNFMKVFKPCVVVSGILVAASVVVFAVRGEKNFGMDFRGGTRINFSFNEAQDINTVRGTVEGIKGPDGLPKYSAEIQTVADPYKKGIKVSILSKGVSQFFQLRSSTQKVRELREDLQRVFADTLSHEPFEDLPESEVTKNPRWSEKGAPGGGLIVYLRGEGLNLEEILGKIRKDCEAFLERDSRGNVILSMGEDLERASAMAGSPKGLTKVKLLASRADIPDAGSPKIRKIRDVVKRLAEKGEIPISMDPFTSEGRIGPSVAAELKDSSILAMLIAWALMIVYVGVRFASWRFGVAAVIALIHDALIAVGFVSLCGAVIPKAWGLSFEMNMTTVAAILTIIGFSINDTIVIYDRVRENLAMMKKETFAEIINTTVNQMLGRTLLTSATVWLTCVILYVCTMTSAGGVAEFAFPMLIGVLAGVYSTVYVASAIVLWWYRGAKPQISS